MKQLHLLFLLFTFHFIHSQNTEYKVFNTSVNSKYAELGVTYLNNNNVLFASSKKNDNEKSFIVDRRKNNKQLYIELYKGIITPKGDIIQSEKFTSETNNKFYVSDITFTPDFKTVYFTWNNFYNTKSRKDSAKWRTLHLAKATVTDNFKISNISSLPFNSSEYSISNPEISKDGKRLFFVSDMPNGYGENDIYFVDILNDGSYSTPKNLGPNINTSQSEFFPFVDKNNTLYFSSYGHKGKGNIDIFKSNFKNNSYQKAENLPSPINSKKDDFAFVIDSSTQTGFFSSTRKGGKGDADIYAFKVKDKIVECTKEITGLIINKETKKSIDKVQIALYHNTILQETKIIIKDSKYSFKLECDENYNIIVKKDGFASEEFEIKTTATDNAELSKNIALTPIKCTQLITGTVLNAVNNNSLDNVTISLFYNNTLIESKIITKNAKFKFEVDCAKTYKIVAKKEGFIDAEIQIKTNKTNNNENSETIKLSPVECNQLITGTALNAENNNSLDNVTISLFYNNTLIESKIITKNAKFKFEVDCAKTYKIVAKKEGFIDAEIQVKTTKTNKKENSETIKLSPVECNQLITGTVLNSENNNPLNNYQVSLFQENILKNNKTIKIGNTFKFELECENSYTILVQKEGYISTEIKLNTNSINKTSISKTFSLKPIECKQLFTGIILDKETNKPLSKALLEIYTNNHLIKTLTLNEKATFSYELDCKTPYKIVASLKNYQNIILQISTSNKLKENISKTLLLKPNVEFITVREQKMIKTNPIYFDLDQSTIRPDAAVELEKVVGILYKYPTIKIEIKSHTDSRAPDNYNMNLSNKRAKSTMNYIISRGIDASRITGKGYGETQILNKCSNGVKCTNAEHEINRRTEFIIIEE
ncbi:OmpA family protein [Lutibacter sp.]